MESHHPGVHYQPAVRCSGGEDRPRRSWLCKQIAAGVGFDPRRTEKLFDAFYTTKHDGMGIGRAGWLVLMPIPCRSSEEGA
jgi:hypothetical protein